MAHALLSTAFSLMAEDRCIKACMDLLIWIIKYFQQTSLVSDRPQLSMRMLTFHIISLEYCLYIQHCTHTSIQIPDDCSSANQFLLAVQQKNSARLAPKVAMQTVLTIRTPETVQPDSKKQSATPPLHLPPVKW